MTDNDLALATTLGDDLDLADTWEDRRKPAAWSNYLALRGLADESPDQIERNAFRLLYCVEYGLRRDHVAHKQVGCGACEPRRDIVLIGLAPVEKFFRKQTGQLACKQFRKTDIQNSLV